MPKRDSVIILALDVSSVSTGFVVLRNGRWTKSGASFGLIKPARGVETLPARLVGFRDKIDNLLHRVAPTHVVIEDVFSGRNISTMKLLARYNGVAIEAAARYLRKDPYIVLTTEARASVGCGHKKEEAFAYICSRYGLDWSFSKMNDVADALVLALYEHKRLKETNA